MEEMEEKILDLVRKAKKGSLDSRSIEKQLGIATTADFVQFSHTLDQMEEDYQLVRNPQGRYLTREQAGLIAGRLSINRKGVGYVDREVGPSLVIEEENQADAMDQDMVVVQPLGMENDAKVLKVTQRASDHLIATCRNTPRGLQIVPDDEKLADKPLKVLSAKNFTPLVGLKVLLKIEQYGTPLTVSVARVIGHQDDPGVDILSILLDHEIEPEFPADATEQAEAIAQIVPDAERQGRTDLTGRTIVTIDGDDSKDFDDAVGIETTAGGWKLFVSIADVSHYVTQDSPLDLEARKRGTSTYVTDRVVPMLPHLLSNGICSLNPHEVRLTNTCEITVGRDGSFKDYQLYPSVMCSSERMTYQNVNKILAKDPEMSAKYAHLGSLFIDLKACADAIRAARHQKGAIDFASPEAEIRVDEKGVPIQVEARHQGPAEMMIEDCMIAANVCVADQMKQRDLPCIYRIHEAPQARRLKDFVRISEIMGHRFVLPGGTVKPADVQQYLESCQDCDEFPVLSALMLRCMQKARYDASCLGHFGLAEQEYLHFTSPIRRYPDLIVHRMLRKYCFESCTDASQLKQDEDRVQEYAEQSSIRERASADAEWEAEDMKEAEYMQNKIGASAEGIITSVTSYGFYVQLPDTIEGLVRVSSMNDDFYRYDEDRMELVGERTKKVYRIGQKQAIVVLAASKEARTIDFGLPEAGRPKRRPVTGHREIRRAASASRDQQSTGRFDCREKRGGRTSQKDVHSDRNRRRSGNFDRSRKPRYQGSSQKRRGKRK